MAANGSKRVRINISGTIFEVHDSTFDKIHDGILAKKEERKAYWDTERDEYFFDHSANCFEGILQYYQSGVLKVPGGTHLATFIESLVYFEFSDELIADFRRREAILIEQKPEMPDTKFKQDLWLFLEDAASSKKARFYSVLSMIVIFLAILFLCWESYPNYVGLDCVKVNALLNGVHVAGKAMPELENTFFLLEVFCVLWFTVELLLRFFSCPSKSRFLMRPIELVDLVSILPFYLSTIYLIITEHCPTSDGYFLYVMRILRIIRVFKLTRFNRGLRILQISLMENMRALTCVIIAFFIGGLLFGWVLYVAEIETEKTKVLNVVDGYYWGVITMTTVGYGDIVPVTGLGRLVATMAIITGVFVVIMPGPIIVASFNRFYRNDTGRGYEEPTWSRRER